MGKRLDVVVVVIIERAPVRPTFPCSAGRLNDDDDDQFRDRIEMQRCRIQQEIAVQIRETNHLAPPTDPFLLCSEKTF